MAKVKYYYDSDTLSYKKIKNKISVVLKRISLAMISAFMFMVLGYVVLTPLFDSPKEKELKRQLEFLKLNEETEIPGKGCRSKITYHIGAKNKFFLLVFTPFFKTVFLIRFSKLKSWILEVNKITQYFIQSN